MARLIDADAFEVFEFSSKSEDFADGVLYVLDKIDEAPTIEAEPVRCDVCEIMEKGHGRIRLYHGNGRQVAIGRGVDGYELVISHFGEHFATKIDYCPYCGAKIDGGAKE